MRIIQVKKLEVKNKILEAAKEEFLSVGFQKASLREIAARAKVTKGNIYVYFKNKDELFSVLVQPAIDNFFEALDYDYTQMDSEDIVMELYSEDHTKESFFKHVEIVTSHKEEMQLLLFCSDGSSQANFRDDIAEAYERNSARFYNHVERYVPSFKNNITHMFMHACALLYINFIEEVIKHEPSEEDLTMYITQMSTFVRSGMQGILNN